MIKVSIKLDRRRRLKNGKYPLKFKIARKDTAVFIGTGYELKDEEWDNINEKVKNLPEKKVINTKLAKRLLALNEKIEKLQDEGKLRYFTNKRLIQYLQNEENDLLSEKMLFKTQINAFIQTKNKETTKIIYRTTINKLKELYDYDTLRIDEIDIEWLDEFVEKLKEQGNKVNSVATRLRNIRAVLNFSRKRGLLKEFVFDMYSIKEEETPKRSLTVRELRKLYHAELPKAQAKHRDIFFLVFFLMGINLVDLFSLTKIEAGRIMYRRAKTGTLYDVKVEPEALAIFEKYKGQKKILSIFDKIPDYKRYTSLSDRMLKKISESIGIPSISLYWARHTFATIAYEIGISIDVIADCLGHKGGHRVTSIYIRKNQRKIDEANRKIIDYVLYNKRE